MTDKTTDRRTFLAVGSAAVMTGLAGCAAFSESDQPGKHNPDPQESEHHPVEPFGPAGIWDGEEFEIEPGTTIELLGFSDRWEGVSPAEMEGATNPVLVLEDGGEYEVVWENGDGVTHDFQIWDEDEEVVNDIVSDRVEEEGETTSIEFTATEEMMIYVCQFHPNNQIGGIIVE